MAATQSPIVFIGMGEHMEDLEPFNAQTFVSKLLGMGDISGLVDRIKDAVPSEEQQEKMMERLQQGKFTMRDMYEQFQNILKMGPLNKVMEMIPGFSNLIKQSGGPQVDASQRIKAPFFSSSFLHSLFLLPPPPSLLCIALSYLPAQMWMTIMDSMNDAGVHHLSPPSPPSPVVCICLCACTAR